MKSFKVKIVGINDGFENNHNNNHHDYKIHYEKSEETIESDDEDYEYNKKENGNDVFENVDPKTIYDELKPILVFSRIFGFTPLYVSGNKPRSSPIFSAQNILLVLLISYHMYVAADATEGHSSRSALSLFFFKVIATCRNVYAMFVLLHFMARAKTCIEVWILMEEINVILRGIHVFINFKNNKLWNYATTGIFLAIFSGFFAGYSATMSEPLSFSFCVLFFFPLFNNYLLIFYFSMLTTNLKKKCRLMNLLFREDIEMYNSRHEGRRTISFMEARQQSLQILRKVRALKRVHLKMYDVVTKLNTLFGVHFIYIFVMYFCLGSLHSFTIMRYISSDQMPQALFLESVLTLTIETICITFAVYGGIIASREMRRTVILVHKFLTMIGEGDVNLENELQSFCMQLQQCGMDFTAWDLFYIDFTMLFQFTVAFFSNAVFFLQLDNMNNSKN